MSNSKVQLGRLGEQLVADFFGVQINENFYDTEKDLTLSDGTHVEVKTQNRHPQGMFTIRSPYNTRGLNNVIKCFIVDRLLFVEYDSSDTITIWECTNRKKYKTFTTRDGRDMIGFPISEMQVLEVHVDSNLARKMRSLSQSKLVGV
jgi:hypothetical protein